MTAPTRLQLSRTKGFNLQELSRAVNGLEAVEAAVIKALGGKITPSGQMDAILQDQNERDRFPRPMGGSHDTSL